MFDCRLHKVRQPAKCLSDWALALSFCFVTLVAVVRGLGFDVGSSYLFVKANVIACFVASAVCLFFLRKDNRLGRVVSIVAALIVILLSGVTLAEVLSSVETGVDYLFLQHPFDWSGSEHPERMGFLTASALFVFGGGLLALRAGFLWTAQMFFFAVFSTAYFSIVTFLFGPILHFGSVDQVPMSPYSGFLVALLSLSGFFYDTKDGPAALIVSRSSGGWVFRMLLPVVLSGPVAIGMLQLFGEHIAYFDSSFRIAFMMILLSVVFVIILWCVAHTLDRLTSARRKAEEALRASEERYRLLTENCVAAVCTHELVCDEQGKPIDYVYTGANMAFETQTGVSHTGIVGKKASDFTPEVIGFGLVERYANVVKTGVSDAFDLYMPSIDRYYYICAYRLDGTHFAKVFVDITERKKTAQLLEKREAFLNLLIETIPIPVFCKDTNGRYLFVNKAFATLFWKPKEQIIGKTVYDMLPPDIAETADANDALVLQKAGTVAYYEKLIDGMGVEHEVIFQKAALTDKDGNIEGLIGAILNISDQKRSEEALREAEDQLSAARAQRANDGRKPSRKK